MFQLNFYYIYAFFWIFRFLDKIYNFNKLLNFKSFDFIPKMITLGIKQ